MMRGMRNLIDRSIECVLVCFRRFGETAQFSNELKRRRANFVVRRGRCKIMQGLDVSAHAKSCTADYADQDGFIFVYNLRVADFFCCVWRGKNGPT
jgi:hypothetical protein